MLVAERNLIDTGDRMVPSIDDMITIVKMNGGLFLKLRETPETMTEASPLSPREIETLNRVAWGNSNKEIARLFDISENTVKNHLTSIMQKLDAKDRTHAVVIALRQGWLSI